MFNLCYQRVNEFNTFCIEFLSFLRIKKHLSKQIEECNLKGTPMQIRKSLHVFVFILKWYPENFAFRMLRILELFSRKVYIFLKK